MRFVVCTSEISPCPAEDLSTVALGDTLNLFTLGITAPDIALVYSWGFSMVLFGWLLGYGIRLAKDAIDKL